MKNQTLKIENQTVKEIKTGLGNQQQKTKKKWSRTKTLISVLGSLASIISLILFFFTGQSDPGHLSGLKGDSDTKSPTKQQSTIPISQRSQSQDRVNVQVLDDRGNPVEGASILLISQNTTYLEGKTNSSGKTVISYYGNRIFTIFCAHPNFPAFLKKDFDPQNGFLLIQLSRSSNIGSVVLPDSDGYIPGLEGRLNPILDTSERMYLYADNIAINGGKIQPVTFTLNKPVEVEDRKGSNFTLRFMGVIGRSWLIEFQSRGQHHR